MTVGNAARFARSGHSKAFLAVSSIIHPLLAICKI